MITKIGLHMVFIISDPFIVVFALDRSAPLTSRASSHGFCKFLCFISFCVMIPGILHFYVQVDANVVVVLS